MRRLALLLVLSGTVVVAPGARAELCAGGVTLLTGADDGLVTAVPATGTRAGIAATVFQPSGAGVYADIVGVRSDGRLGYRSDLRPDNLPRIWGGLDLGGGRSRTDVLTSLVRTSAGGCTQISVRAHDGATGALRHQTQVDIPFRGQGGNNALVTGLVDVTGDGSAEAFVELRLPERDAVGPDRTYGTAQGHDCTPGRAAGLVVQVDGRTGRATTLVSQLQTLGPGPFVGTYPTASGAAVLTAANVVGGDGRSVDVVARRGGKVLWQRRLATRPILHTLLGTRRGPLLVTTEPTPDGSGNLGTTEHTMTQLDGRTGAVLWSTELDREDFQQGFAVRGDVVLVHRLSGVVERRSADTGARLWSVTPVPGLVFPIPVGDDLLVASSTEGSALVRSTGEVADAYAWRHLNGQAAAVGDLTGDGVVDVVGLVAPTTLEKLTGGVVPSEDDGRLPQGLSLVSGRDGRVVWTGRDDDSAARRAGARVRPGRVDVLSLVGGSTLTLRDGATGALVWTRELSD